MNDVPVPSAKRSLRQRLLKPLGSRSRASSPSPSPSTIQSQGSSSTQALPLSSHPSAGTAAANLPNASPAFLSSRASSRDLLDHALKQLSDRDRATLRDHILSTSSDITLALEQALAGAEKQQRCCIEKRWTFTIAGRTVTLKDEADKVVHWLNRFKGVGDIVANVDPVHVGLPWAGIRLLLEASVSEANQMNSLLVGCETALYMANRLKAYIEFSHSLPISLTYSNFEAVLISLYSRILQFLSRAIQIYQTPTLKRAFTAVWKASDIQDFEKECDQLGMRAEIEASNCDRTLRAQDREGYVQKNQDLQKVLKELEKHHKLQESLDRIEIKIDLDKLPCVKGAMFDSYGAVHVTCHPATRVDLLRQIQDWARQPHGKSIFWLNGMAGTGKSTISWTVAKWLTSQGPSPLINLGACFFFKRGEGDRGSASQFFPTIVHQLLSKIPGLDALIAAVIDSDPWICDKALGEQFDKLIYQPLEKVKIPASACSTLVVVVDALDECEKESEIRALLQLWPRLSQIKSICLRLFLTSRPDLPIRLGFKGMSTDAHQDMILHEVPRKIIQHDISVFLKDAFSRIREDYNNASSLDTLDQDWPGDQMLQGLADKAVPLFIVAATVCRFVGDLNFIPRERLQTIMRFQGIGQRSQMEQIYLPVLKQMSANLSEPSDEPQLYQEFRMIVGAIVTLAEPISIQSLAAVLNVRPAMIERRLRSLHSVLQIPTDPETPIRAFHLSFSEFLLSEKLRDQPFGVDGPATHRMLLTKCLELLSGPKGLRENICDLKYPGQPRQEIVSTVIKEHLLPAFQYACRYWVHHLQHSMIQIHDGHEVCLFLQRHFLHWLEALSLMNKIGEIIGYVVALQSLVSGKLNDSTYLSSFLEDARRFVLANRYIADLAPLQIYSSATIFAPQTSIVRNICGHIPAWIRRYPITPATWGQDVQTLEGHTDAVIAVAFSPDGSLLASASEDKTVKLWNPTTGQEVQTFEGHTKGVTAVAFSPDSSLLASASDNETVRLWNPTTGQEVQTLEGHTDWVEAVAFSPDGSLLASASWDRTIRLWNPTTGQEVQTLEGHTNWVKGVAFSPDGSLLASASKDTTVRLWNPTTSQEVQTLEGHTDWVKGVAFSPDGSLLASASKDETVRLWNPTTGQEVQTFGGHSGWVNAVVFSPDSSLLASASSDKTVKLWNPTTGQEVQTLEGHTDWVNAVAFSPDGSLLASASWDKTVGLWNPTTGQEVQTFEGHTKGVTAVAFSPDGSLLASASWDKTVRLWNPTNGEEIQSIEYLTVYNISFTIDNKTLLTERGSMTFERPISATASSINANKTHLLTDVWIQQDGYNILWLPHEYRHRIYDSACAFHDNTFAIGRPSGQVSFIQLAYS